MKLLKSYPWECIVSGLLWIWCYLYYLPVCFINLYYIALIVHGILLLQIQVRSAQ